MEGDLLYKSGTPIGEPSSPISGETIDRMEEEVLLASPKPVVSAAPCLEDVQPEVGGSCAAAPVVVTSLGKGKLNGAARKRFRRLIAANVEVNEARALAVKPWNQIPIQNVPPDPKPKPTKRQRSEEESPKEQPKKAPRLEASHGVSPKLSFKQVAEAKRVGIRSATSMSDDQMKQVHRALTLAMLEVVGRGKGPKFAGFTHKPGWILVTCENQESLGWLEREVPKVKPWTGAELSIIPESELPKPMVVITFVPSSEVESLDEAIQLLRTQNEGLNTELWKVLHSKSEENGYVVTFSLDELSVEALAAVDFRATLGFKKVTFKVRGGSESKPPTVVETDPQPSTSSGQGSSGQGMGGPGPRSIEARRPPRPAPQSSARPPRQGATAPRGGRQTDGWTEVNRGRGARQKLVGSKPRYRRGNL